MSTQGQKKVVEQIETQGDMRIVGVISNTYGGVNRKIAPNSIIGYLVYHEKLNQTMSIPAENLRAMLEHYKFSNVELDSNGVVVCTECALSNFPVYNMLNNGSLEPSSSVRANPTIYVLGEIKVRGQIEGYRVVTYDTNVQDVTLDELRGYVDSGAFKLVNMHYTSATGNTLVANEQKKLITITKTTVREKSSNEPTEHKNKTGSVNNNFGHPVSAQAKKAYMMRLRFALKFYSKNFRIDNVVNVLPQGSYKFTASTAVKRWYVEMPEKGRISTVQYKKFLSILKEVILPLCKNDEEKEILKFHLKTLNKGYKALMQNENNTVVWNKAKREVGLSLFVVLQFLQRDGVTISQDFFNSREIYKEDYQDAITEDYKIYLIPETIQAVTGKAGFYPDLYKIGDNNILTVNYKEWLAKQEKNKMIKKFSGTKGFELSMIDGNDTVRQLIEKALPKGMKSLAPAYTTSNNISVNVVKKFYKEKCGVQIGDIDFVDTMFLIQCERLKSNASKAVKKAVFGTEDNYYKYTPEEYTALIDGALTLMFAFETLHNPELVDTVYPYFANDCTEIGFDKSIATMINLEEFTDLKWFINTGYTCLYDQTNDELYKFNPRRKSALARMYYSIVPFLTKPVKQDAINLLYTGVPSTMKEIF